MTLVGATKLGTVSITLGVVFFAACLIEIFGFVCAVTVRPFNLDNLPTSTLSAVC